ncbi:hypothetical protein [Saccharothrix deserti]|nr:hypothetical protein [Saccharothrix deserti]
MSSTTQLYAVLWFYGVLVDKASAANFMLGPGLKGNPNARSA